MWDLTYAPSVKKLYELGFSPSQVGRKKKRGTALKRQNNGNVAQKSVSFANSITSSSYASVAYSPSLAETEQRALSAKARARRQSALKAAEDRQSWEKKLRTPSKQKNKGGSSRYNRDKSVVQSPRPHNSRAPVSPNSRRTHLQRVVAWLCQQSKTIF